MTISEYDNVLTNLLFETVDVEDIAQETFQILDDKHRIELAQDILTNFGIEFPNRNDDYE